MRVLIAGGGIAGLTLAAKLRQQGRAPVVIERLPEYSDAGYAIGLYTLGSCVLHGLGVYQEFVNCSVESRRYEMLDHKGARLQELDLSTLANQIGPLFMLSRADLIRVLCKACADVEIRMGTTIETIDQGGGRVRVVFSDGTADEVDLLVGCDGIHSGIRARIRRAAGIRHGLDGLDLVGARWAGSQRYHTRVLGPRISIRRLSDSGPVHVRRRSAQRRCPGSEFTK